MNIFDIKMNKKEIKFIIFISILLVFITLIPVLYAYFFAPLGLYYTGRHAQNSGDVAVYFSQMEQARNGHLLFENLYTSEPQGRTILNPFWLLLGFIGRITGLSNIFIYQLVRVFLIPIFVFAAYLLISYFFQNKTKRKIGLLLICFAGGIANYAYTIDGSAFLSVMFSPHLVMSLILIIFVFLLMLFSWHKNKIILSIIAGLLVLFLFFFHPYHISTVLGILGVYLIILLIKNYKNFWPYIAKFLILVVITLPAILYHYWYFKKENIARIWLEQSDKLMHSRPPWEILGSLGFLSLLAIFGSYIYLKNKKNIFPLIWVVTSLILVWTPFFFRMRLTGGLSIALSLLAIEGIYFILKYFKEKKYSVVAITLFGLLCFGLLIPVNLNVFLQNIAVYYQKVPMAYINSFEIQSFGWIKYNLKDDDVVLASWINGFGNLIPGYTGKKVFLGHGIQTINSEVKWEAVRWFFLNDNQQEEKKKFLNDNNINYIFYSKYEKDLGNFNPEKTDYLKKVFESKEITIFMIK